MAKDWFSQIEERRHSLLFAVILVTLVTFAVASMRDPMSYDSFWHLRMGHDWVENGLSPFVDHYSFTHRGEAVSAPPYLFQALYYQTVDLFGLDAGYKILFFVALLLALAMLVIWLRLVRAPTAIWLLAIPLMTLLLFQRGNLRPELFAYPLMILSLIFYEKARIEPRPKHFLAIVATMLVFTNYHSAVLGYVIFFGLFVDLAVGQIQSRAPLGKWLAWTGWGTAVVAVGFANPEWSHPVLRQLSFSEEWYSLVREYRSPWEQDLALVATYLLFALVTVSLLLRQRYFGYAVVALIFTWYASQILRMIVPAGIVILCLFTLTLSRLDLRAVTMQGSQTRRLLTASLFAALVILPLLAGVSEARTRVKSNPSLLGYFPDQLAEYMKDRGKQGRVFNDYVLGGYLIYHLAPEVQVYIDGRTAILYPVEHHKRWVNASTNAEVLISEIEEWDIDFVALSNRPEHVELMAKIPSMKLDYADLRYSLYAREDANFPLGGALWGRPWCWDEDSEADLQEERNTARFIVPGYSLLLPILNLAAGYASADDKAAYLRQQAAKDPNAWSDSTLRIAAYRALELEEDELALGFLTRVQEPLLPDLLAMGLANLHLGRLDWAEHSLQGALQLGRAGTEVHELIILFGLLTELDESRPLRQIPRSQLEAVARLVEGQGAALPAVPVSPDWFCETGS